jgi:hypothetical protein
VLAARGGDAIGLGSGDARDVAARDLIDALGQEPPAGKARRRGDARLLGHGPDRRRGRRPCAAHDDREERRAYAPHRGETPSAMRRALDPHVRPAVRSAQ